MTFKGWVLVFMLVSPGFVYSAPSDKKEPSSTPTASSLDEERKRLELERMQLENEKLKLELERAKLQMSGPQTVLVPKESPKENRKEDLQAYQFEIGNKAEELAKANKDQADIIILDFTNGEIWHHGVRYSLHELYSLAQEMKWPFKRIVASRASNGYPRYLYKIHNTSLLRYEGHDRGIVEILPPSKEGDFKVLTVEGSSFDSPVGDIRNAYQSIYFSFDGQSKRDNGDVLRYKHSRGLNFSDKLEFLVGKDGKINKIRYGVLDEH